MHFIIILCNIQHTGLRLLFQYNIYKARLPFIQWEVMSWMTHHVWKKHSWLRKYGASSKLYPDLTTRQRDKKTIGEGQAV